MDHVYSSRGTYQRDIFVSLIKHCSSSQLSDIMIFYVDEVIVFVAGIIIISTEVCLIVG